MEADIVFHIVLTEIPVRYSRQVFVLKKGHHMSSHSRDTKKLCGGTSIFSLPLQRPLQKLALMYL